MTKFFELAFRKNGVSNSNLQGSFTALSSSHMFCHFPVHLSWMDVISIKVSILFEYLSKSGLAVDFDLMQINVTLFFCQLA